MGYWNTIAQVIDEKAPSPMVADEWKHKLSLWDRGELSYYDLPLEVQAIIEELTEMYENIATAQREERSVEV